MARWTERDLRGAMDRESCAARRTRKIPVRRDGRDTVAARWVGRDLSGAMGKKMLVDVDGLVQVRVHVRVHVLDHVTVNARDRQDLHEQIV